MVTLKCFKNWRFEHQCYPFCRVDNEVCLYKNESTYLHWLTSTRDPILEVVNEICWLSITISSSCRKIRKFWYGIETNIDVGVILIKISLTFHKLQKKSYLSPNSVWLWPKGVIFFQYLYLGDAEEYKLIINILEYL